MSCSEAIEKEANAPRERWCHWHWQNLNEKWPKGADRSERCGEPKLGWGLRAGRCWWHFRSKGKRPGATIRLEWSVGRLSCGAGFRWSDEDLTLSLRCILFSVYLSLSTDFRWIDAIAPKKPLNEATYPGVIVIDERECDIAIHSGSLWLKAWGGDGWTRSDPWWKRGVSFSVNPFEPVHMRHEVRCFNDGGKAWNSYYWEPFVDSWESISWLGANIPKHPDHREIVIYPYRYVLKSGEAQERTATVYVERRAWRPKCFKWTSLFEKSRICIDVAFSDEVGERTGSWKGGCTGCSWEMLPGETPEQALRRMESVRKFT